MPNPLFEPTDEDGQKVIEAAKEASGAALEAMERASKSVLGDANKVDTKEGRLHMAASILTVSVLHRTIFEATAKFLGPGAAAGAFVEAVKAVNMTKLMQQGSPSGGPPPFSQN